MAWSLATLLCIALAALGCASGGGSLVPPPLVGSAWVAQAVDGQGMVDRPPVTLAFESGERAAGSTGCNRYFAAVQMSGRMSGPTYGTDLRFGQVGSTRMACSPEVMDLEQRFLAALASVRSYRIDGVALVLLDGMGLARVRLIRAPRGAASRPDVA